MRRRRDKAPACGIVGGLRRRAAARPGVLGPRVHENQHACGRPARKRLPGPLDVHAAARLRAVALVHGRAFGGRDGARCRRVACSAGRESAAQGPPAWRSQRRRTHRTGACRPRHGRRARWLVRGRMARARGAGLTLSVQRNGCLGKHVVIARRHVRTRTHTCCPFLPFDSELWSVAVCQRQPLSAVTRLRAPVCRNWGRKREKR